MIMLCREWFKPCEGTAKALSPMLFCSCSDRRDRVSRVPRVFLTRTACIYIASVVFLLLQRFRKLLQAMLSKERLATRLLCVVTIPASWRLCERESSRWKKRMRCFIDQLSMALVVCRILVLTSKAIPCIIVIPPVTP